MIARPHDLVIAFFPAFTAARYTLDGRERVLLLHNDAPELRSKRTFFEMRVQRAEYQRRRRSEVI